VIYRTRHQNGSPTGARNAIRRRARLLLLGAAALLGPVAFAAPASATGPYPGETLSLALSGPAVAGQATNLVASGQQTDVNEYAGGFSLDVFEKDPSVDPTCSPDYWDETNNALTDPSELHFIIGDWEGLDTTFSVPFKAVFSKPAPVLLCAYSDWITDTAASAQLTVDVANPADNGTGNTTTTTTTTTPPPPAKPVDKIRPALTRSHKTLICSRGVWLNAPSIFAYRWLANGHQIHGAKRFKLKLSHSLRGRRVQCSVSATNSAGTATALSRSLKVH
jgi:hypothetical protein